MFVLTKFLFTSVFVGLICCLVAVGAVGLWSGVPLAFLEFLPGDDLEPLRKLPRDMIAAGMGGFAVGSMAGIASQCTGQRVSYFASTALVSIFTLCAIVWTHPNLNINVDSGIGDYLNSYWMTGLAALGGTAAVVGLGILLKPIQGFRRDKSRSA